MPRKLVIVLLLAGICASPAAAQQRRILMPQVTFERGVQFTLHGPVAIHIVTAPKPGGLYALRPVLSNGTIVGRETLSSMQRRISREATVVGVNGDLFAWADGRPSGIVMHDRVLMSPPQSGRSSVGVADDGSLRVERVAFFGTWRGTGQRRALNGLNEAPGPNGISLFTPAFGPTTPAQPGSVSAVFESFPAAVPNTELIANVAQVVRNGSVRIPPEGAALVARGTAGTKLAEEALVGLDVTVGLILKPDWIDVRDAIGGGPVLVRKGQPVFRANEAFLTSQLVPRHPRTGVGQLADGRIIFVAVDGRQPGYSIGMTNFELAQTLVRLGAVTGSALDAGGSTTIAFEGEVLNRPSDGGGERAVSDALMVFYYGVHASAPDEEVLSPNGDGVAERQGVSYKVVRPSSVTETLLAPDGTPVLTETVERQPGVYRREWDGAELAAAVQPEGRWRYVVYAMDDTGQTSEVTRPFTLNRTLGFLRVHPARLAVRPRGRPLVVSATLTRPARIVATVETRTGVVIRTLARRTFPAGPLRLTWDGRSGRGDLAYSGSYVVRVTARNGVGPVELAQPLTVRRVGTPRSTGPIVKFRR